MPRTSVLTMFLSSSKSSCASCFDTCVLPTPVGPRKRKLPMGRVLAARPARARMMASATAFTAGSCPITCFFSRSSSPSTRSRSPWLSFDTGMPVHRETTAATCSGPTQSCSMALPLFLTSSSLAAYRSWRRGSSVYLSSAAFSTLRSLVCFVLFWFDRRMDQN